jgi:acyl transferase domain-containing protein
MEKAGVAPIPVVGMQLPGRIDAPAPLPKAPRRGGDLLTGVPTKRSGTDVHSGVSERGAFLNVIADFDPLCMGITEIEPF